jgi:hypothetical protein
MPSDKVDQDQPAAPKPATIDNRLGRWWRWGLAFFTESDVEAGAAGSPVTVRFASIRHRNWLRKMWGWGLTILAAVNAIDFESPFPIPLTGTAAISASILVGIVGGILLYLTYRPHEGDALELAAQTDGILTVLIVKKALGISLRTAEKTIQRLWKNGYLKLIRAPQDPLALTLPIEIEPAVATAMEHMRIGQQELAQCVFRVPFSAGAKPEPSRLHSDRIVEEQIDPQDLQALLGRFDGMPHQRQ